MQNLIKVDSELYNLSVPRVMGILNVTTDSFYDGGRYLEKSSIINKVATMLEEGADIIDIGACSTRPGAKLVAEQEEIKVISSVLNEVRRVFPDVFVSVDTFRSSVSKVAVEEFGVQLVNDISAGTMDGRMFETIAKLQVPYILMHMQGTPVYMQQKPEYSSSVSKDVFSLLSLKICHLRSLGVNDIILDPGFGFGKTLDHNYQLMQFLDDINVFDLPFLVGISRKSMIYQLLDGKASEALNGTTALNMFALTKGASFLRVHDVKEAVETVKIYTKLNSL